MLLVVALVILALAGEPDFTQRHVLNRNRTVIRDQRAARRQSDVNSAARAAWSGSVASEARG